MDQNLSPSKVGVKRLGDMARSPTKLQPQGQRLSVQTSQMFSTSSNLGGDLYDRQCSGGNDDPDAMFAKGIAHLPHELQIRVPALQTAQALGILGFYESACESSQAMGKVPLPKELAADLQIAFETYCVTMGPEGSELERCVTTSGPEKSVLESSSVRAALMYAGIFEDPPNIGTDALSAEEFGELGRDMLIAHLDEDHIKTTKQMFEKYDDDDSGHLDITELSTCFAETIHPKCQCRGG